MLDVVAQVFFLLCWLTTPLVFFVTTSAYIALHHKSRRSGRMPRLQRRIDTARKGRQPPAPVEQAAESTSIKKLVGCPVFDPIDCQCRDKTRVAEGEGVKMTCTSETCQFARIPLHPQCYQELESNLVKRLGSLGSARGWTVPQRLNNLWEKKGQSLIGKFCRCRCGRGQMTRDKQALYEKEKAVEKEKKKKAKKAKQLPQLHFNTKHAAAMEEKKRDSDCPFTPTGAPQSVRQRTFSTRSRLLTDHSTTSSVPTTVMLETMSEVSYVGESNGQYNNNEQHPMDLTDDEGVDEAASSVNTIVPAPPPPPQTKSYAATIKSEVEKSEELAATESPSKNSTAANSPDSGLAHSIRLSPGVPNYSLQESADESESETMKQRTEPENLNPLELSILSPIVLSQGLQHQEEPLMSLFPELTVTPHLPKQKGSIYSKITEIRAQKSASLPKLPLALPSLPEGDRCGINFTTPVREIMDVWQATNASLGASGDARTEERVEEEKVDFAWTPMFGRGFNLGERILYFP
ncbi:unnamed protein product [Caenorhabditis sp. 36 PRJEB53466]|nr:unnamed protein product [Caenorhabditis sp. 36 PRJEB53466]